MLIGRGLIAKAFSEFESNDSVCIFASGVSCSTERDQKEFEREKKLLENVVAEIGDTLIVYFSTCSIEDLTMQDMLYIKHKKEIENYLKKSVKNYLIFRLPQVVGNSSNPHTLVNFLYNSIKNGTHFMIWKRAKRYLLDIEDIQKIASYIVKKDIKNKTINIAPTYPISVYEIVKTLEKILNKVAEYSITDKGGVYHIDITDIKEIIKELDMDMCDRTYSTKILLKYYKGRL